jgi:hypothetical protein
MISVFIAIWMIGVILTYIGFVLYGTKNRYNEFMSASRCACMIFWPFVLLWVFIVDKIGKEKIEKIFGYGTPSDNF